MLIANILAYLPPPPKEKEEEEEKQIYEITILCVCLHLQLLNQQTSFLKMWYECYVTVLEATPTSYLLISYHQ